MVHGCQFLKEKNIKKIILEFYLTGNCHIPNCLVTVIIEINKPSVSEIFFAVLMRLCRVKLDEQTQEDVDAHFSTPVYNPLFFNLSRAVPRRCRHTYSDM